MNRPNSLDKLASRGGLDHKPGRSQGETLINHLRIARRSQNNHRDRLERLVGFDGPESIQVCFTTAQTVKDDDRRIGNPLTFEPVQGLACIVET